MDAHTTEREWLVNRWRRLTNQDRIAESRFANFEAPDLTLDEIAEATYEGLDDLIEFVRPVPRGDNLLVTNFDNQTVVDENSNFVSVVHLLERHSYTPIEGGYNETVIVEGDRERLREAVRRALDYAREHRLRVQVNNPYVRADIEAGLLDVSGLRIVGAPDQYTIEGYEVLERVAKRQGNSAMLQVPAGDVGKRFKVVRIDP
jgi:putative transposon-encoded protein